MRQTCVRAHVLIAFTVLCGSPCLAGTGLVPQRLASGASGSVGKSVAMQGDTLVVGAPGVGGGGAVFVYSRDGNSWSQTCQIPAPSGSSRFGSAVALSGMTLVVGDPEAGSSLGAAWVFTLTPGVNCTSSLAPGGTALTCTLSGRSAFGASVATDGNRILVGAPDFQGGFGAVALYTWSGSAWSAPKHVMSTRFYSTLGYAVALSGTTAIIALPNLGGRAVPAVYLVPISSFPCDYLEDPWSSCSTGLQVLTAGTSRTDRFGSALSVSRGRLAVGAMGASAGDGAAYLYDLSSAAQLATVNPPVGGSSRQFGASVALSADTLVVGGDSHDYSGYSLTGGTYVYGKASDSSWPLVQTLVPPAASSIDSQFGASVAISGDAVVIGAPAYGPGYAYYWLTGCGFGHDIVTGQWAMFTTSCTSAATVGNLARLLPESAIYGTHWNVFQRAYDGSGGGSYVSLAGTSTPLEQGTGYWFKTLVDPVSVPFIAQQPLSLTTSTDCPSGCFEIRLRKPVNRGTSLFNLVGAPLPVDVSWANVKVRVSSGSGSTLYTPAQADGTGGNPNHSPAVLADLIWLWNGANYQSYNSGTPGAVGTLRPGSAFWVEVFDANSADDVALLIAPPANLLLRAFALPPGTLGAGEWYTRFTLECAAERLKATDKILGQLNASLAGYDKNDLAAMAPTFTPYLTMAFPHADWGAKAGNYATDYRAVRAGSDNWSFQIQTDRPGRQVTLSWSTAGSAPPNMSLLDNTTGKIVALQSGSYTFTMTATTRNFAWRAFNWPAR